MPRGLPEGFQWLEADPDTRFSGYPAQDTPVLPTYRDYPQNTGVPYGEEIPKPLGYATHRPLVFLGRTMEDVPGLVKPGTIDLTDPFKPTQDAFHIEDGGMHVVLPNWGSREAMIAQYKETGQSFGKFKDAESADAYTRHLNDWSQYEAPKPYGLGVISENALGQPTGPKKGRKDAATVNAEIERQMQASGGNSELVSIPPEPQESIRDKDRQVGMIEPPNIDLDNLTPYALPTGEMDTLRPILYNDPKSKQTVLIPSLIDGTVFSRSAAIRDYEKTGKHLGKFKDELYASEYRSQLQDRQNQFYGIAASMTQYANEASGVPEPPTPPGSLAPRLTPEEKAARAREQNPYPLPTLLSPETGKMEEVDPRWANARGIPIGMPRPGGGGPRPTGGPEYPDKEGRAAMLGDPGLLASAERRNRNEMSTDNPGVPEGFQWLGADDPAAQAAQESAQKAEQQAGGGYEQGIASTFGYNDPEDNGVGAWGDITDDPNAYGVALPVRQLREMFGDPDKAYGAIVELTNPHTGQTVRAPILDKGPAEWVLNRQGPTIDVTEGVRRQMGLGGKSDMQWRVLGHGFPSDNPMLGPGGPLEGFQWEGNGDIAKPVGQGATGLPEGFQWLPAEGQPTTDTGAIVPGGKGTPIAPPSEEESNRLIEAEQTKPTPSEDRIDVPELDQKQPQAPVQQPVRDPAERAANRQRLIDAIQTSEDAGYPVPHTIGTPEEPEGDRGPTRDMEHLVEALKLAEEDAKASNEKWQAAQIGKERAYWEDHIKTFGMSAEQAAKAEAKPATEGKPVYTQGPKPKGMLEEGNLDINNRPVLHNPDGTISTESSISIDDNGKEVLIPTVIDGKRVTNTEAVGHYKTTGENLGKFDSPEAADAYAKTLHQRGYTEEQKKAEDARNQAQQQKAGLPRFSLSQEMAFAKAGERHSRGLGAKESELPTLTPQEADKLGLKSWMDPSGVEVRRATLPDVMRARRAHEIGDQPYEMGFNTYAGRLKGMPSDDLEVMKQIRNSVWFKARVDKGEKEEDILKNIRNDVGTQAALRFAAGAESGAKGIPKGAFDMLSSATHDYRNQYLKATPEEAAKAVPVLEMSLEQEKKRAQELLTKTKGAEDLIPGTGYPKPPELGGVTRGPLPAYGPGQRGYVDSKGEYAQSLLEIANISRQLAYAKDRAAGKPAQESFLGQVSRKAGEDAAYFYRKEQEGKKKYQAFINDAMEKDRGKVVKFVMDFASSTGNTAPSLALMLANPYVGFAAFATQQYSDSLDEYLTQNPRKPGEDPTEYFNKSRAYARDMMVEQVPFEAVGDFAALTVMKRAFREIPAAVLARANGKEIGKFVAKAAVEGGISEGVTQPPQTFIQETRAEAAGVQAPTTREEKLAKAGYETGLAVTQGMAMGGAGAGLGAASLRSQTASRDARVIQHIKEAIAQRKAEEQTPYAQGGAIPSVAGPSTKSTGLFPSQATPSTAAPAPPPNLTKRFNDLTPDARARVQAVPLMHWDQAIRNEEANIAAAAAAGTGPITPPAPGPEVEGPTTDAELEKMKQDYLGGPAAASALARSLGARTPAEEKQVLADNFRHLTKFHKSVLALGADFRTDHGARTSGVVNWDDSSGKLKATLTINPTLLLSRTVKSPLAPGGEARIVGGEELLHLADITSLGKLWENDKTANHNPGGFDQYLSQVSENELKDVENAVMSAPQAERDSLLQGLSDVHHVYLGDYTAPSGLPANRDIFKAIRSDPRTGKNNTFKFIFETARMVAQQKAQGLISEHTARNIWTNLNDYFNKVLARITGQLPRFEQGAYGPMMQAHVQRMQDQMAQWEAELKLQGKPALMPQLTPEERARATAEKPQAAYERPPPAPKT